MDVWGIEDGKEDSEGKIKLSSTCPRSLNVESSVACVERLMQNVHYWRTIQVVGVRSSEARSRFLMESLIDGHW